MTVQAKMADHPIQIGGRSEVERLAAQEIAAALRRCSNDRDRVFLALPGGRSIIGVLRQLRDQNVPWPAVVVLPADERCLPEGDPDRNWEVIHTELLAPLIGRGVLPPENCAPFRCREKEPDWGLGEFAEALSLPLSGDGVPVVDVVVLGAGEDGHVASLFPRSPQLQTADLGFLRVHESPKPPPHRITLSPAMIAAASTSVLLFFGSAKQQALRAFSNPLIPTDECPARLVTHARVYTVFADHDAAAANRNCHEAW